MPVKVRGPGGRRGCARTRSDAETQRVRSRAMTALALQASLERLQAHDGRLA